MVNLILQPIFLNLVKGSTDLKMTSDDFYNMWSVATKAKTAIVQGRRLENLSWRLWYTSTIRSKAELEEMKKHGKSECECNCECEFECKCKYKFKCSNEDLSNSDSNVSTSTSEIPSDRPLFTSICTSILAEIQDASFKFGQGSLSTNLHNLHSNHNTHVHLNFNTHSSTPLHTHTNTHTHNLDTHLNSISPSNQQISRSKSPAQTLPRKKKNVEKFLKKFKSNLEDITERFEEKITFTTDDDDDINDIDEETNEDKALVSVPIALNNKNNNNNERHVIELSPTSSNHFATDEEGHDSSFYSRSGRIDDSINLEKLDVMNKKKKQDSMITKLLKFEEISSSPEYFKYNNEKYKRNSDSTDSTVNNNLNDVSRVLNIAPIHSQTPNFQLSSNTESSSLLSNNHQNKIDLLISNRYDRIRNPLMSPKLIDQDLNKNKNALRTEGKQITVDANALSTSLSASKFSLDDEFDSLIVIW